MGETSFLGRLGRHRKGLIWGGVGILGGVVLVWIGVLVWVGWAGWGLVRSSGSLYRVVVRNNTEGFEKIYGSWRRDLGVFSERVLVLDSLSGGVLDRRWGVREWVGAGRVIGEKLPELLGKEGRKVYYVLLQNNMELRPSGGFMGSYAKVWFEDGGVVDVDFQDIYVPDGQIKGHVEPPWPIQEAFEQGWWKLRDANWDADFPTAARVIEWFFEKGGEQKGDGIVAINLGLVEDLLRVTGPMKLVDYGREVGAEDLYDVVQYQSEANFFPGSTQKKDVLTAVGMALMVEMRQLGAREIWQVGQVLVKGLREREILVFLNDKELQNLMRDLEWDGGMRRKGMDDYLYVVETNLGANKANCCVTREVRQEVGFNEDKVRERLMVIYENLLEGPRAVWGGDYNNFLRVYLPIEANVLSIKVSSSAPASEDKDGEEVPKDKVLVDRREEKGIAGVGFFVKVPRGMERGVEVEYELPVTVDWQRSYRLQVQKQPGMSGLNYELRVMRDGDVREVKKFLREDGEFRWEWK